MDEDRTAIAPHTTAKAPEGQSWSAPTLGDFTTETDFSALSDSERRRIAKHAAWSANMPPETFGDIKLFHHEASRSGMGPVVWRGVAAAMAVLMGGRGGVDIPSGDRQGVYNHLAGHYKQFDKEPPPLRSQQEGGVERRMFDLETVELRIVRDDGQPPRIEGHAAVFNKWSLLISGYFKERILPGAFSKTLMESKDILSLYNHDPNMVLGRTSNKRLELREDEKGLWFGVTPTDTAYARDLFTNIEERNVTGNSFGFVTVKDRWASDEEGMTTRELVEVRLLDAGPVTFPAYPDTDVAVRMFLEAEQRIGRRLQGKRLEQLVGLASSLKDAAGALEELISWARQDDNDDEGAPSRSGDHLAAELERLRRRVDVRLKA
jgi:HK97 family phage prohead protease